MAKRIRTEPVSLNESTLESNIAAEIKALFDSPFNFGYPDRLRWLFGFDRLNLQAFTKRRTRLYRLTPIEENKGGGWDTKISIPNGSGDKRAIFIQFKSGTHSDGNSVTNSIFNLTLKNSNEHVDFTFNDNSNNNQHQTLKDLSDHLHAKGVSEKAVMYGFPRITDLTKFENLDDDLLLHTTFLTIKEMDDDADEAKVNLYDGNEHHFRTCYFDENRREISSEPFQLNTAGIFDNVLYEVLLVKMAHLRNHLQKTSPIELLNEDFFLSLANYLKINPFELYDFWEFPEQIKDESRLYFKDLEKQRDKNMRNIFGEDAYNNEMIEWRKNLFNKIVKFFSQKENYEININEDIPSNYTINLSKLGSEFEYTSETQNDVSMIVF